MIPATNLRLVSTARVLLLLWLSISAALGFRHHHHFHDASLQSVIANPTLEINNIPFSTRAHWIRRASAALSDLALPCQMSTFATAIVNHSVPGLGELVCLGVNSGSRIGNPTLHGEHTNISSSEYSVCAILTC